jgi:hypothetical protein
MTDVVEKGKNEPIEIFAYPPVETDSSRPNASQRPYEGHWLEIELIICPLHHFRVTARAPLKKFVRAPEKPFSTVSTHHDTSGGLFAVVHNLPGSLRLDARGLDHLSPFVGLVGDELAELRRRA